MTAVPTPDAGLRISINVELPSDVSYIERVVDLVRHPCLELKFNSHQLNLNVPVALAEALSNAILRANREDPGKRVRVHAEVNAQRLVVEIADEGAPFDLESSARDATQAENLEREDGRGIFLMRRLMDDVQRFDASPTGPGNVVRLTLTRA